VSGFVFYDENANGLADPGEAMRLPGVTVMIGGSSSQSSSGGRVTVPNVQTGAQTATVRPDSLPAYFTAGPAVPVSVPQAAGTEVAVPATLATSGTRPRTYMAFGDSITFGDGSNDGSGYRSYLSVDLQGFWGGTHSVLNEGISATRSNRGDARIGESLRRTNPAYTLILYGTNDWNDCGADAPCYTIDALRSMVAQARSFGSYPILGTIPPVHPDFADRQAALRNDWVRRTNDQLRAMARQERVQVADIHDAFLKRGNLPLLFRDFLHPNEEGFALMAQVWLRAITQPVGASTSSRSDRFPFGFAPPGLR
jgi:lysophospholipase L1-like esterase